MPRSRLNPSLSLIDARFGATVEGAQELILETDAGKIPARFHAAGDGDAAVVWVGGAGGGLDGPAEGMYPRLARQLASDGIASLRLHYRRPNQLYDCVLDALLGVAYLGTQGRTRVVLVGHSFGGAVVISAGSVDDHVIAVAALSSQTYGTDQVAQVSPR